MIWVLGALIFWALAWALNVRLSRTPWPWTRIAVPVIFGITLLVLWEGLVRGLGVKPVILPPPSLVAETFAASIPMLWEDFQQTVLKGALSGFAIGASAALLTAVLIDLSAFLTRGLLPIGNFVAALPIASTIRRATVSLSRRRTGSISINAKRASRRAGKCSASPTMFFMKIVDPAPMNAIFGIGSVPI